jgi:hypothetical protein
VPNVPEPALPVRADRPDLPPGDAPPAPSIDPPPAGVDESDQADHRAARAAEIACRMRRPPGRRIFLTTSGTYEHDLTARAGLTADDVIRENLDGLGSADEDQVVWDLTGPGPRVVAVIRPRPDGAAPEVIRFDGDGPPAAAAPAADQDDAEADGHDEPESAPSRRVPQTDRRPLLRQVLTICPPGDSSPVTLHLVVVSDDWDLARENDLVELQEAGWQEHPLEVFGLKFFLRVLG